MRSEFRNDWDLILTIAGAVPILIRRTGKLMKRYLLVYFIADGSGSIRLTGILVNSSYQFVSFVPDIAEVLLVFCRSISGSAQCRYIQLAKQFVLKCGYVCV